MTTAACRPQVEGGLLVVLEWPAMRDHGAEKRRQSQGEQFGMCNWAGRTFRPKSSARGLAGMKTAVSVSRASADTAAGRTPALTASAMGAERRPARGRRRLCYWLACSYFWTPVVSRKGKRNKQRTCNPLRGRSAHVALAVSEGPTTLRGCGGRGAACPLTASEGQGLDPLETG